jgi:hypothetical protein
MATQQVPEPPPVVVTSVFQPGKLSVEMIPVDHDALSMPPIPILIAAPKDAGTYPVAVLLHGFFLQNGFYEQLLKHVASRSASSWWRHSSTRASCPTATPTTSPRQPGSRTGSPGACRPCSRPASRPTSPGSPWPATAPAAARPLL